MKYGIREICEVVLKAKATQQVGNKVFYKNEPVIYFDTLKTSSLEGSATTVYAEGGRGNSRLVAWEGERTVTFTMEDALISPEGFMILSGAGLVEPTDKATLKQHITETIDASDKENGKVKVAGTSMTIELSETAYLPNDQKDNFAYVMLVKDGEIISEPYIPTHADGKTITVEEHTNYVNDENGNYEIDDKISGKDFDSVIVDYYTERKSNIQQIEITPDKFGGNYYLEASTLFRAQNGQDYPAEFIIPNCKIQSNFTFSMASTGDPSTFTFTMDAFPDYTRFDHSKKVLAAIQIISGSEDESDYRLSTVHDKKKQ